MPVGSANTSRVYSGGCLVSMLNRALQSREAALLGAYGIRRVIPLVVE